MASAQPFERALDKLQKVVDLTQTGTSAPDRDKITAAISAIETVGVELEARNEELSSAVVKLDQERRRYREMFHLAPAGYLQTDNGDLITEANLAASRMLRVEQDRLVGKSILTFIPDRDRRAFKVQLAVLHDGQELWNRRMRLLPREANPMIVLMDVTPARDDDGHITGYRWLFREVGISTTTPTERETQALDLLETVPAGFFAVDREWRLRYVNRAAASIMRHTPEEVVGRSLWEAFPAAAIGRFADIGHKVMEDRTAIDFEEYYEALKIWVEGTAFPSDDGVSVFFRDVTQRKQNERDVAELAAIVRATSDAVVSLDNKGNIVSWNAGAAKLLGYRGSEAIGKAFEILVPANRRDELDFLDDVDPADARYETKAVRKSGDQADVSVVRSPIRDASGARIGYSIIYRDASEWVRVESRLRRTLQKEHAVVDRLREVDQMKDTLLVAVSHDLKTPLAAILGLALTLRRTKTYANDSEGELLDRLINNAQKLDRLVTDLLDLDRISRAILEPNRVLIDVGAVAHRVALELGEPGRPVRIDSGSVRAEVDPVLVERILENLVANALKYAGSEAAVELSVSLDQTGVLIVVDDRGPGVPDDLKEAIWDPFQRGTSMHAGSGIGLTVVQRFAELHGGRAWVEDRPGGGASFRVLLPGAVEP